MIMTSAKINKTLPEDDC